MIKKFLFLFFLTVIGFTSCQFFERNKNVNDIIEIVCDVEMIVNKYDNNVQSALDSKKFDYILTVANSAMTSSNQQLEKLEAILVPVNEQNLKSAAVSYVKALQNIIKAEKEYSTLSDSIDVDRAQYLDSLNLSVINEAEDVRLAYMAQVDAQK